MKNQFTFNNQNHSQNKETKSFGNIEYTHGPSERVINNLLNYSRSLVVLKTKMFGAVNTIMN